eukprot:1841687-Rhodomonas_salina.5
MAGYGVETVFPDIPPYARSVPDIAQHMWHHMLGQYRASNSMRVGRYHHTLGQYGTWRSRRVGRYRGPTTMAPMSPENPPTICTMPGSSIRGISTMCLVAAYVRSVRCLEAACARSVPDIA